jgi:type VI protein secretion system component Hcp
MSSRVKLQLYITLVATLMTLPSIAHAALRLLVEATGSSQGAILGDSTVLGYENWIELDSFSHSVFVSTGPNGLPEGQTQVSQLDVSGQFNRSTVKLMKALSTNESFSSFKLELVDDGGGAKMPMAILRYKLTGAYVSTSSTSGITDAIPSLYFGFSYYKVDITDVVEGTKVFYYWTPPATNAPESQSIGILLAPAPNPTHGRATFRFALPRDSNAQLTLFDLRGHRVRELYSGWTSSDAMTVDWNGMDERGQKVAQGVYMARLTYPGHEVTQRITVLR